MLAAVFAMLSRGARASGSSCELVYLDIGSNIGDSLHSFAFHRPAKVLALARSSASPHHERPVALYALHPPDFMYVCLLLSLLLALSGHTQLAPLHAATCRLRRPEAVVYGRPSPTLTKTLTLTLTLT